MLLMFPCLGRNCDTQLCSTATKTATIRPGTCAHSERKSASHSDGGLFLLPTVVQASAISCSAARARNAERDSRRCLAAASIRWTRDSGRLMFSRTARERT